MANDTLALEQQLPVLRGRSRLNALLELASELWQRNPPQAVIYSREAYGLATALNQAPAQAAALLELGRNLFRTGAFQEAVPVLEQAITLFQAQEDTLALARSWMSLGSVRCALGLRPQALRAFFLAQIMFEDAGNTWYLADCLNNIGIVYERLDNYEMALHYHSRALILAKSVDSRYTQASATNNIGQNLYNLKRWDEALMYQLEALALSHASGSVYNEIVALINAGCSLSSLERYAEAEEHLNRALQLSRDCQDRQNTILILDELGLLYRRQGNDKKACTFYRQAIKILSGIGVMYLEAQLHLNLSEALKSLGRRKETHAALLHALQSAEQQNLPKQLSQIHLHLSAFHEKCQQYGAALSHHKQHLVLEQAVQQESFEQRSAVLLLEQEYKEQTTSGFLPRLQAAAPDLRQFLQPAKSLSNSRQEGPNLLDLPNFQKALKFAFQTSRDELQPLALVLLELEHTTLSNVSKDTDPIPEWLESIKQTLPPTTIFGHLEENVLGVLLPGLSPSQAWELCNGWRQLRLQPQNAPTSPWTLHLGLCTQTAWSRAEDMLSCAGRLLYQAKCLETGQLLSDWKH